MKYNKQHKMNETYHLRIQGTTGQEAVLAFPSGIASRVDQIFQEQYKTGSEFAKALEDKRQDVLDAIASNYPSEPKTFLYSIEGDKLVLRPIASAGQGGEINTQHSKNDHYSMGVMAMLLGNYLHIRGLFSSAEGPVTIRKTFDDAGDESYFRNGDAPLKEWAAIFEGKAEGVERKFIKIKPILTTSN